MRVYVYYNLHRHCWSVRTAGRLKEHCHSVALVDCTFKVSRAGRQRVLRTRQKNVHAGVSGTQVPMTPDIFAVCTRRVRYNPYDCESFVDARTGEAVYDAPCVIMDYGKVYVPEAISEEARSGSTHD